MRNLSTERSSDWHEYETAAAATEVVVTRDAAANARHYMTAFGVSYSATTTGNLSIYGLTKVGPLDLTDTDVLDLTGDTFTLAGHGLANGQKVVFHAMGGTAPTGLTSGNTYFVVGVSGDDFQLESSVGGGAINMSGTQANFTEIALILPVSKSWEIYDNAQTAMPSPWAGPENTPLILKLEAVTDIIGEANMSGYSM